MKKSTLLVAISTLCLFFAGSGFAAPLNLSSWTESTYDLTGGQSAGNWVLSNGNTTVTQAVNADPSMYLNNLNQTSYQMDGSWKVNTTSDDDFMGFVFGYQDNSHFYIMDWKQNAQNAGTAYGTAQEGFTIRKISANSATELTLKDFWSSTATTNSSILATSYSSSSGWADNTLYDFHLDFAPGVFSINVSLGLTELWDVTVNDNSYSSGQFGFYNFSQAQVQYSGFEQTGGVIVAPVPEPATVLLLGAGLIGLGFYRRKKQDS